MKRPFSIGWAGAMAIIFFAALALANDEAGQPSSIDFPSWILVPILLFGIPFTAWLPHARAGTLWDQWRVPHHTLLMPRWLVCLVGTQMIGVSLGELALCVFVDVRFGLLCVLNSLGAIAFVVSASRRFARHPKSEFVMPSPFPYPLRKRM